MWVYFLRVSPSEVAFRSSTGLQLIGMWVTRSISWLSNHKFFPWAGVDRWHIVSGGSPRAVIAFLFVYLCKQVRLLVCSSRAVNGCPVIDWLACLGVVSQRPPAVATDENATWIEESTCAPLHAQAAPQPGAVNHLSTAPSIMPISDQVPIEEMPGT